MDNEVLKAIAKWPNVPAVYGWLSLNSRGLWRFHPEGAGLSGGEGESIGNTQLQAFISRNYAPDARGCWYFQNGPQRVYVRLDAAPFVIRIGDDGTGFLAHTGMAVKSITAWWLDQAGRLFAQTDLGPAIVLDRDLQTVIDQLSDGTGHAMIDTLSELKKGGRIDVRHPVCHHAAPLMVVGKQEIPALLHFTPQPIPAVSH